MYATRKRFDSFRDRKVKRDWWDKFFTENGRFGVYRQPRNGWIHEARFCLFMSFNDIAVRMGKSRWAVAKYERMERSKGISIGTLSSVAEAMDCELVYYFVPKRRTFTALLNEQKAKHKKYIHVAAQSFWKTRGTV